MVREWFTIPKKKGLVSGPRAFRLFFIFWGVGWVDRWTSRKKISGRRSWGATNALSQAVCGLASRDFRLRVDGCKICRKTDESWGCLGENDVNVYMLCIYHGLFVHFRNKI